MWLRAEAFIAVLLIPLTSSALAADAGASDQTLAVARESDGKVHCVIENGGKPSSEQTALVRVNVKSGITVTKLLVREKPDAPAKKLDLLKDGTTLSVKVGRDEVESGSAGLEVEADGKAVSCGEPLRLFDSATTQDDSDSIPQIGRSWDDAANEWWLANGEAQLKSLREALQNLGVSSCAQTEVRVHLPSGAAAAGFQPGVTEGTPFQVAMIVPPNHSVAARLKTEDCAIVDPFRTQPVKEKDEKKKQGKRIPQGAGASEFRLVPIDDVMRCGAGDLKYQVAAQFVGTDGDGVESVEFGRTLRMRPKYHLAAIATLGWDSTNRAEFDKLPTSEAKKFTIGRHSDHQGPIAYVGAEWMIMGVDYENLEWWNYFANLVVAANPESPLDDFLVGVAATPVGSVSLVVGATFHEGRRLKNGAKVGDPFDGDGDLPVERSWGDAEVGGFVGLSIDSNIYDALLKGLSK